jgi:hypothetical protein
MTFSRTLSPISNNYKIGGVLLSRKESVDDLGILFDKGLSFVDHINSITSTAFKNLGYIYRNHFGILPVGNCCFLRLLDQS